MTGLRNLWEDLVDRRLWPLAVVLVAALAAVPLFLARPAPDEQPHTGATPGASAVPAPPTPGLASSISDVSGTPFAGPVRGDAKDPFRPQGGVAGGGPTATAASVVAAAGGVTSVSSASSGGGSGSASSGGGATSGSGSGSPSGGGSGSAPTATTPSTTAPVPGVRPPAIAALQFGLLGGEATNRRVAELTPLPSPVSPAVVYLGQSRSGESVFLVSSDATATGDGRCTPNRELCSRLYLRPGQVAYLTVSTTAGQAVRYRLKFIGRLPA